MNAPIWMEIVCAVLLLYGLISGWRNGLVKELCSTVGFVAGFFVAWYCHVHYNLGWGFTLLLCIATPILLGFLASLVSLVINNIFAIGTLNKLLGAILGCVKYGLLILFLSWLRNEITEWGTLLQ